MKIGLIDIDHISDSPKFPNLALMKLSAYHKKIGDHVEWYDVTESYDIVYGSQVFDFSDPMPIITNADRVIIGGVAINFENKLPPEVESIYPDYDLYGFDEAYGFLTRGCPRDCAFCNVTQHQGRKSIKVADLSYFWHDQKVIKLLDPNMYSCSDWKDLSQQLIDSNAYIDFTQGIDIRLMTDEKIETLNEMKVKMLHFAWDNYEMKTYEKLKRFRKTMIIRGRDLGVYVLTNFNTTHEQDLERVMKLRELDYTPYVMIYDKHNAPRVTRNLQGWVNNKILWRTVDRFEDVNRHADRKYKPPIEGQETLFDSESEFARRLTEGH